MNHLINFNQYQHQQQQRQKEEWQREQEQRQQQQRQKEEWQKEQEQREREQRQQEQYRQQQQPQYRNYFLPSMNRLISNQSPIQNRENYDPNRGHYGSFPGHAREQGISFGSSSNPSRSSWPIDKLNGWFESPFNRESQDSSPERQTAVVDNPFELRNRPTGRGTWRSFNADSPDVSPERQNEVVDRNRSQTGANGNSSKSGRDIWRKGVNKNKSAGTGYIGFKPEPKRRRTMEPTKAEDRERLEPIKSWAQLSKEAREARKVNSVSGSAQARDTLKTKNQQTSDLDKPRKRSEGKIMTLPLWRRKWYLRYIAQGFSTEEAMSMSWEPVQPATAYNAKKWKGTTTPQSTPNATNLAAATAVEDVDKETDQEPEEQLKICLKPVGYPAKKLNYKEKMQLEEAIIEEVRLSRGVGRLQQPPPLRFTSIHYRLGYIEVCCFNQETAKWLLNCGSKLSTYQGPPVEVLQDSMPDKLVHPISLFLPRSAGKPDGYIRELLKAQNSLNIEMWRITQRKDQGTGCVIRFDIDDESAKEIVANEHKVFYRLSTVAVTGLEKLDKPIAASVGQIISKEDEVPKRASVKQPAEINMSVRIPMQEKVLFTIDLASDNEENEQNLAAGEASLVKKRSAEMKTARAVAASEVIILEDKVVDEGTNAAKADEGNIVQKQTEVSKTGKMQAEEGNIVEKKAENKVVANPVEEKNPIKIQKTVAGKVTIQEMKEKKLIQGNEPIEGSKTLNKENIIAKNVEKPAEDKEEKEKQAELKVVSKLLEEKDPIEMPPNVAEKESIQEIKEKEQVQEKEPIEGSKTLNKENIIAKNVEESKDASEDGKTLAENESKVEKPAEPASLGNSLYS